MAFVSIIFVALFIFVLLLSYNLFFKPSSKLLIIAIVFIIFFLGILGLTLYIGLIELNNTDDFSKLIPYGDYIGGIINPIISVFAVFAAGFAFYAQYDANRQVQRQFEEQKKGVYVQNFESNFYNLLSIHHQIIQDIDYYLSSIYKLKGRDYSYIFDKNEFLSQNNEKISKSRDVFKNSLRLLYVFLLNELMRLSDKEPKNNDIFRVLALMTVSEIKNKDKSIKTKYNDIYNSFYIKYDTDFGHYFRNLYRLIKIVDEKKFSENIIEDYKIKYSYTSIIRAQLSDAEIKWLFLNCLSDKGYKKFKPLVEKYSILKIINLNDEVFGYFSKFYLDSAFNNPSTDQLIKKHLEIDFYNNDVFKPKFSYLKIKKLD